MTEKKTRKKNRVLRVIIIIVAVIVVIAGVLFAIRKKHMKDIGTDNSTVREAVVTDDPKVLNVSIYPYVPNPGYMEKVAERMFKEIEPDVTLNFVDWDCYLSAEPENIDVFSYDSLFLDQLYESGYASEIDYSGYDDIEDIPEFAFKDTLVEDNGEYKTVGIPFLLCSNFLIYREDDTEVGSVENIYELYDAVGEKGYGRNSGLVADFVDNYPYFYLEANHDDKDPEDRILKAGTTDKNPQAEKTVELFSKMIGSKKSLMAGFYGWMNGDFAQADLFDKGFGRALFGYSENLSSVQENIDDMNIKFISLGDGPNYIEFYTDLVSINSDVTDPEKRKYCEELAELIASKEYIYEIGLNEGTPAYLLPARMSIFDDLAQEYPMYAELKEELDSVDEKHVCRYGSWIFDYINALYGDLAVYLP